MARLLVLILTLGLGTSIWINVRQAGSAAETARELTRQSVKIGAIEAELTRLQHERSSGATEQQARVESLRQALAAQKQLVDDAANRLAVARNGGLPSGAEAARVEAAIRQEQGVIQDLERQLTDSRAHDSSAGASPPEGVRPGGGQALDTQLLEAQAKIRATEAEIQPLKRPADLDEQTRLKALKDRLRAERDALGVLKGQKQALANQRTVVRGDLQVARESLKQSRQALRDQLGTEKQKLGGLQENLDQLKKIARSASQSQTQLENADREARARYQELEGQLNDETRRLQALGPAGTR